MSDRPPRIALISCDFGWGYQGDSELLAVGLPQWERVVCCGAVEAERLLDAFAAGFAGVLLLACPRGECHFQDGEWQCLKRVTLLQTLLDAHGIDRRRLMIQFGNDPTGESIASVVQKFSERLEVL